VKLDEYEGREGLIPISEIARGWIKYIRDYVREGQKVVCKVLHVNRERGHIDLSLKDVNEHQRREKINEWKNEQKAKKWLSFVSEAANVPQEKIEEAIYREYGMLFPAFEDVLVDEDATFARLGFDGPLAEAFAHVASENVKISKVTITGFLRLTSTKPDGVNVIRRALRSAQPKVEGVKIDLNYIGAPIYRVKVTALDYKTAERAIEKVAKAAIGVMERAGDTGEFVRKQKAGKH
jgi:translation initiation factor 2 subunit 1